MAKGNRDLVKEQFWREAVARQVSSGLKVRAFCQQEPLAESAFYAWRRTIRERDGQVQSLRRPFVPAVVTQEVTSGTSFTLELAGGQVLRMPGTTSVEKVADLIVALEARRPR